MLYSVAIIGGGFSGLCSAVRLGEELGAQIVILEANKRIGKKILSTGNGQGNITNVNVSEQFYHGDVDFAKKGLKRFSNNELLNFFDKLGLITAVKEGKVYPASFTAGAILDVLRFKLEELKVEIKCEASVVSISKKNNFCIECSNGEKIYAKKVICAFGGSSGAGFMTDGSSYKLLTSLGHSLTRITPSLVQLKTEREKLKGLKGIKQEAIVSLYDGVRHVKDFEGDVLFTDYGVSGNSIFSISAYLSEVKKPILKIEYLPTVSAETLIDKITKKCDGKSEWEKVLVSVLPTRLIYAIMRECNLSHTDIAKKNDVYNVVCAIKGFSLKVEGPAGFESSQVTSGGISTAEINAHDMQSKIISDLYVVGEALNVDGNCGGYNLQWAYTSAMIASEGILNEKG